MKQAIQATFTFLLYRKTFFQRHFLLKKPYLLRK